jgi:hypothetical protein
MSISWGRTERYKFASSGALTRWTPPQAPAIYAITYNQDPSRPKSHTILFVGEADDLSQKAAALNAQVLEAWQSSNNDVNDLYVFVHHMPGSTPGERCKVQEQLVSEYVPRCNR